MKQNKQKEIRRHKSKLNQFPREAGERRSKRESEDTRANEISFQGKQETEEAKGNQETQEQMKIKSVQK